MIFLDFYELHNILMDFYEIHDLLGPWLFVALRGSSVALQFWGRGSSWLFVARPWLLMFWVVVHFPFRC